jgi:enoyl-CoA hydratase/carnithine racemase
MSPVGAEGDRMQLKVIGYRIDGAVAIIELSRPKRRNAWTGRMHSEYRWCLEQAERDTSVRVVVVTGDPAGGAFCPGADYAALERHVEKGEYDPGMDAEPARPGYGVDPHFDATFAYHFGVGKPIIAAINGAAAGVGLVLAAFADLRLAVAGAKFTAAHGRFNFPAEYGLSWVLPRIVGLTHANDILLSCRVFTAEEALGFGFLNGVCAEGELMSRVMDYARTMASSVSPGSARTAKRQIYRDLHRDAASAVNDAERLLDEMVRHPNNREGVAAWLEKRRPDWVPDD